MGGIGKGFHDPEFFRRFRVQAGDKFPAHAVTRVSAGFVELDRDVSLHQRDAKRKPS